MPAPQASVPLSAAAQKEIFSEAYSILEQAISEKAFPGASFGVLAGEKILALDGVGRFTYDSASPPVTPSTIFDLASLTKVMVTTAMAMLLHHRSGDRGDLPLDAPLANWLPDFAAHEAPAGPRHAVTLKMLLTHSSGLPGYAPLFRSCRDRASLLDAALQLPLLAEPGAKTEYSDPGFILLGRALEAVAGQPLDLFCAREVFDRLGMSSARFRPPSHWLASIPPTEQDTAFRHREIRGEVQDENCFVLGGVSGHAGLFSNSLDVLRYAASILNSLSPLPGEAAPQIFSSRVVELFTTRAGSPPGTSRALGWDTPSEPSSSGRLFSPRSAGHLGYSGTSLWIDLDRRVAVVLLTNRTWPDRSSDRIRQVRPRFHDAIRRAIDPLSSCSKL